MPGSLLSLFCFSFCFAHTRTIWLLGSVITNTVQMMDFACSPPVLEKEIHAMRSSLGFLIVAYFVYFKHCQKPLWAFHSKRLLCGSKYLSNATFPYFCLPGTGALSVCCSSACASLLSNCSVTSDISLPPSLSAVLL